MYLRAVRPLLAALAVSLALVAVTAGGAVSAPAAAPAGARAADPFKALAALYLKAAATVVADRTRCARMIPDLAAFLKAHPEAKALSAATAALSPLQHGQDEAAFKGSLQVHQVKVSAAAAGCKKAAALVGPFSVFKPLYYPNIVVLP